ncbi:MFS transporter [Nocardiopsis exhalans]|uniref:MFS transporter n=1 Tax=Nocardiopsis exhalans TaxID=163604 RepID=A0ABY5D2L5_9ACTN|nr:MFS transporter [Nocardiopsis exhalans]USY17763.1 MFS transporter [Nocardiopsis exhalans]
MTNASRSSVTSGRERLGGTFHRFWAAGVSTNFGDGLPAVALPLIAPSPRTLLVTGLTVARFLPWLLLAPPSGALLDRADRLRALVAANTAVAATVALLTLAPATGHTTVWMLCAAVSYALCAVLVTTVVVLCSVRASIEVAELRDRAVTEQGPTEQD